ncbi:helix-turn-helix transcriptional regulator [Thermostaphylospora chromogena]|uniref:Regulatory protein, luxR family n=1 Tax=Thermostaphylospora chromogena TaxID=35622 RepID=A0A1H1A516_9ACTN|nr:LuxR C-terminal-related transcriptional regulator [Thermostaphylospora chromogena]SDQ34742.1 regulatory protein, luxR family [Thermostaphylospora chromogena]
MPTLQQIAAAAEIGMRAMRPSTPDAAREALRLLADALHGDAASLVWMDPFDGEHRELAGIGYPAPTARSLARDFARTPWFGLAMTETLPPSISAEKEQTFRRGWFYEEHIAPAGFRDGMTGVLRRRGRYVGLIHLSSTTDGAFDEEARRVLASVMPALATMADACGRAEDAVPADDSAALVHGASVVELPHRKPPPVLDDPAFRHVMAEFAAVDGDRLPLLWPVDRTWHRVTLVRPEPPARRPGAVLVRSRPAAIPYGLTGRELDVLTRLAMGRSNQAIAEEFFLSPRTIHTHVEHILHKTGTATRAEAAALAMRESVIRPVPGLPRHAGVRHFVV